MKSIVFCLLCMVCLRLPGYGQSAGTFGALETHFADSLEMLSGWRDRNREETQHLRDRELIRLYERRTERLESSLKNGLLVSDPLINAYFQRILSEILRSNPDAPQNGIKLLLSKDPSPNASCHGQGTIVFNLGLLSRLESEAQIAFIICHELAHQKLNHVNAGIDSYYAYLNSEEVQEKIRKIEKQEFRRFEEGLSLYKALAFDQKRHSRFNEAAADSLGWVYLSNSPYLPNAAVSTLSILDSIDWPDHPGPEISLALGCEEYPFKPEWELKEGMGFALDKEGYLQNDSLKTHPDCKERIIRLAKWIPETQKESKADFLQKAEAFESWKLQARLETVEVFWQWKRYGRTIYHGLKLLDHLGPHPYLVSRVGWSFLALYEARKDHHFNDFVDRYSPDLPEDFRAYNYALNAMRMSELAKVGYWFLEKYREPLQENEDFWACYTLLAHHARRPVAPDLRSEYLQRFPTGKHLDLIQNISQ